MNISCHELDLQKQGAFWKTSNQYFVFSGERVGTMKVIVGKVFWSHNCLSGDGVFCAKLVGEDDEAKIQLHSKMDLNRKCR